MCNFMQCDCGLYVYRAGLTIEDFISFYYTWEALATTSDWSNIKVELKGRDKRREGRDDGKVLQNNYTVFRTRVEKRLSIHHVAVRLS